MFRFSSGTNQTVLNILLKVSHLKDLHKVSSLHSVVHYQIFQFPIVSKRLKCLKIPILSLSIFRCLQRIEELKIIQERDGKVACWKGLWTV